MKVLWHVLAKLLAKPVVVDYLIKRSRRTPYTPIMSADGKEMYMERNWLFNPYDTQEQRDERAGKGLKPKWRFPISIRLHCIRTPDLDRHLHDHPWNARTIILRGAYVDSRYDRDRYLSAGDTSTLRFGKDFHRITHILPAPGDEGVWTLFITGKFRGMWGFDRDGVKIPFKQYLRETGDAMAKEHHGA